MSETNKTNRKLKPCPFCGGEAEFNADSINILDLPESCNHIVECTVCGCRTDIQISMFAAYAVWNSRISVNEGGQ